MADDEAQTKTGGTETGFTGQTGTGATPKTPEQPATDPPKQPSSENNNNKNFANNNVDVEAGQMKTGLAIDPANIGPSSFDCLIARRIFVQKVFGMVGIMLAVVVFMTMLPFVSQSFRIFAIKNWWLWWVGYLFFIISYLVMVCCSGVRRTTPWNYIFTCVLVFSAGWVSIGITIQSDAEVVLLALLMTTLCCTATIIFAIKTKFDMTQCAPLLIIISLIMFIFFIVALVASLAFHVQWLYTVYAGLMCIVMMAYLLYDVQMMMGGKRQEISVQDPYYAAVQIFVDIVMMFWYMVQFLQGVN